MFPPFFTLWISVLLGFLGFYFPLSLPYGLALFSFIFFSRHPKTLVFGVLLGVFRLSLDLDVGPPVIPFGLPLKMEVQIEKVNPFGSEARVLKINDQELGNRYVRLFDSKVKVGDQFRGVGVIRPSSTYERPLLLSSEWMDLQKEKLGKLKWKDPPQKMEEKKSILSSFQIRVRSFLQSSFPLLTHFREAIFLGIAEGIPTSYWKALHYLGLSHALVVSGSHISFLALFFLLMTKRNLSGLRPSRYRIRKCLCAFFILNFCLLCPAEVSIFRAFLSFALIQTLALVCPWIHRYHSTERLAFVGLMLALLSPSEALRPSYLLSFGATWALLQAPGKTKLNWILFPSAVLSPLAYSIGLITHPLSSLLNVILLPLLFGILTPISLINCHFSERVLFWFFEGCTRLSGFLAHHSPALKMPMEVATFFLLMMVMILSSSWNSERRMRISFALLLCFLALTFVPFPNMASHSNFEMDVIDIGQGDGLLLKIEGEFSVGIDGGGPLLGTKKLMPEVLGRLQNQADLWVITHFDRDHVGNYLELQGMIASKEVWIPRFDHSTPSKSLQSLKIPIQEVGLHPRKLCFKRLCLESWTAAPVHSRDVKNSSSLILLVSEKMSGRLIGLLMGDLEAEGEEKLLRVLRSRGPLLFLKAGHHGSKTSSTEKFIEALQPKVVLITSGRENQFRFPHSIVSERLESWGAKVFRVDTLGNFKLRFDF